jgi:hypothetical protein
MKKIKIGYSDFWGELIPDDNYFFNLLSQKYDVEIDNNNPDILFYTVYSRNHMTYDMNKVIKILYTGENQRPNYNECHYSLSFDYSEDPRNYRLPLWALILNWFDRPYRDERDQAYLHNIDDFLNKKHIEKSKFCSFIASNAAGKRLEFLPKIYQYKHIDCGGRIYNNVPQIKGRGDQIYKIEFLKDYKFNIAFENSSFPGYCTEKIINSMFAGCIPIYWGDPLVVDDFNENSFLNWHKFNSDEKLIEEIIKIDNNQDLYNDMINQPWFKDNKIPDFIKPESVLSFFEKIIEQI